MKVMQVVNIIMDFAFTMVDSLLWSKLFGSRSIFQDVKMDVSSSDSDSDDSDDSDAEARPRPPWIRDTLYIGGIPGGSTNEDLMKAFEAHHPKDAVVVRCNSDDRRGFVFIQFATEQDQTNTMQAEREIDFKGGKSIVRYAKRSLSAPRPLSRRRRGGHACRRRRAPPTDM